MYQYFSVKHHTFVCVWQLSMHLNSSLHQVRQTANRPFVVFATALEIWSFISAILPSLLFTHTHRNQIGCCCKSDTPLSFQINFQLMEQQERSFASDPRIKHLNIEAWILNRTSQNMTHTLIKQHNNDRSRIQRNGGISSINVHPQYEQWRLLPGLKREADAEVP